MAQKKQSAELKTSVFPLASDKVARVSEFKKRNRRIFQKRVLASAAEELISEKGWVHRKKLAKGRVLLEKQRSHDEILENRLWCILYHLGFEELNQSRQFQIVVSNDGSSLEKQIDVFARIGEIVVVAECKASVKKQKRSLQKDIGEFASLQRPIANSLRKHFGDENKLKILWLIASSNVIWSQPDRQRAEENNIHIIEERELRYFEEIAKNIGPAARYQFLGEFLSDQKIPMLSDEPIPAIRTKLGGNWIYSFLAPAFRIIPVAFVNHRALRDVDAAPSYQRVLKRSRLKEIGNYLDSGGYFANNILVNFKDRVRFDKQQSFDSKNITLGNLYLPDKFKSVWVIDGQHRLFGFTEAGDKLSHKVIPILAFDKLPVKDEAELFATINGKQQKVARGLLDELSGELKINSEDFNERNGAIAARCLDMLAAETGSPFEDKVKTADLSDNEIVCLTISSIKNEIVSSGLLGKKVRKDLETPGAFSRSSVKDTIEALCVGLNEYFSLIRAANVDRWDRGRSGLLCHNVGVQGHIRLFSALIRYLEQNTKQDPAQFEPEELVEQIANYLAPVIQFIEEANDEDFVSRFRQPFGSGGPPRYFFQLSLLVNQKFPEFIPDGLAEFVLETKSIANDNADSLTKKIVERLHKFVVHQLKTAYGDDFFNKGIPQKDIKLKAHDRKYEETDTDNPIETYLDVVDLKKIVEHRQNWDLFKDYLSIQLPSEPKGQAKYIKWIEKLNEVRRVSAHPAFRSYSKEDIEFLETIHEQLDVRAV